MDRHAVRGTSGLALLVIVLLLALAGCNSDPAPPTPPLIATRPPFTVAVPPSLPPLPPATATSVPPPAATATDLLPTFGPGMITHPTGIYDIVIQMTNGAGLLPRLEVLEAQFPPFTLYGDGTLIYHTATAYHQTHLEETAIQQLLSLASDDVHFFDLATSYPVPGVADASSTQVRINAEGQSHSVSALGLGDLEDSPALGDTKEPRQRLLRLVMALTDLMRDDGPPYVADEVEIYAEENSPSQPATTPQPWPLDGIPLALAAEALASGGSTTISLGGDDGLTALQVAATPQLFTQNGQIYTVLAVPELPAAPPTPMPTQTPRPPPTGTPTAIPLPMPHPKGAIIQMSGGSSPAAHLDQLATNFPTFTLYGNGTLLYHKENHYYQGYLDEAVLQRLLDLIINHERFFQLETFYSARPGVDLPTTHISVSAAGQRHTVSVQALDAAGTPGSADTPIGRMQRVAQALGALMTGTDPPYQPPTVQLYAERADGTANAPAWSLPQVALPSVVQATSGDLGTGVTVTGADAARLLQLAAAPTLFTQSGQVYQVVAVPPLPDTP